LFFKSRDTEMESRDNKMKSRDKVFFLDFNVTMVATIAVLWYLPHGCYGSYHTSVMVATIM